MPTKAAPKKKATKTTKAAAKSTTNAASGTTAAKATAKKAAPKTTAAAKKTAAKAPAKSASRAAKTSKPAAISEFRNFEPYKTKRGEEYMNDKQREHFKNILKKWKSALMEEVDRTVTHMKDEAANFPDPADRATQEEEFSLELRTRDRERKLIKKIDSTIERIEQDDYGFCDACGVEIGIKRLEARPTASLCIDCKTLAEIKERQELG
jgi:DnaK suppressor protein